VMPDLVADVAWFDESPSIRDNRSRIHRKGTPHGSHEAEDR
jgi:hypothetical protein